MMSLRRRERGRGMGGGGLEASRRDGGRYGVSCCQDEYLMSNIS